MKHAIAILVLLACSAADADEIDTSSVIIGARLVESTFDRQPTWIAVYGVLSRNIIHIPADSYIADLRPGKYFVSHIDFGRDQSSKLGTRRLRKPIYFDVAPHAITYLGVFELNDSRKTATFAPDEDLMRNACRKRRAAIEEAPIRLPFNDGAKEAKVSCNVT